MPTVTLRYWPIQYIDNPFKGESRNVGLIAWGEGKSYLKFAGDEDGFSAERFFGSLSPKAKINTWVFREWKEWFECLAKQMSNNPQELEKRLVELDDAGAPFIVGKEGLIEVPDKELRWGGVNQVFKMLVGRIPRTSEMKFGEVLEETLKRSEIIYKDGFERDIEVTFTPAEAPPISVFLPFALIEGQKAAFKVVRFSAHGDRIVKQVNDAVYTFEKIVEHGFAKHEHCIALIDQESPSISTFLERLKLAGKVVDISKGESWRELHSLLAA